MSNEIVKPEDAGCLAVTTIQKGFESPIHPEDLIFPRAKLIQGLSPEMQDVESAGKYRVGMIINSLTKEELPKEFIRIFFWKIWVWFNSRDIKDEENFDPHFKPGDIIWTSNDEHDPRVVEQACFGSHGEKPKAITFFNFMAHFTDITTPLVISFSKTSLKAGKQLLSMAKLSGLDMWGCKYNLTSTMESGAGATFAIYAVSLVGRVTPEEYNLCENLWSNFSPQVKNIKVQDVSDVPF